MEMCVWLIMNLQQQQKTLVRGFNTKGYRVNECSNITLLTVQTMSYNYLNQLVTLLALF